MSETGFGFELALAEMKKGAHIARLKWINRTRPIGRQSKVKIGLSPHGMIRTWYLNYESDSGVVSTDDILANDWVVVEPASTTKPRERG
jgi:hypothetical protein